MVQKRKVKPASPAKNCGVAERPAADVALVVAAEVGPFGRVECLEHEFQPVFFTRFERLPNRASSWEPNAEVKHVPAARTLWICEAVNRFTPARPAH
jgi:hypothetical protein